MHDLGCRRIQCDEVWSFTYAKAKNVKTAKAPPEGAGDTWTWTAIDADTKFAVTWLVGGRDAEYAIEFMDDVAKRLANRVQLTTDGHSAYLQAVEGAFGANVDLCPTGEDLRAGTRGPASVQPGRLHWRRKARRRGPPGSEARQHVIRRAAEPYDADAHAPVHATDECVLQAE